MTEEGELTTSAEIETREGSLKKFLSTIKGEKQLTFEESSLSQWLYVILKDEVDRLVVCNPVFIARNPRTKNDYNDALHLATELRCGHITAVYHEDSPLIRLRALMSGYNDLVLADIKLKNQFKALLRKEGIVPSGKTIYEDLKAAEVLSVEEDRFVDRKLLLSLAHFSRIKREYEVQIKENEERVPEIKKLMSIPGIGNVRAHAIVSATCTAKRFRSKHHYWSYCMLAKHVEKSGGSVMSKRYKYGRVELKEVFISAAQSVLAGNSALKKYFDHLILKGFDRKKARRAVARKIASISLSIMKTGERYSDIKILNQILAP